MAYFSATGDVATDGSAPVGSPVVPILVIGGLAAWYFMSQKKSGNQSGFGANAPRKLGSKLGL